MSKDVKVAGDTKSLATDDKTSVTKVEPSKIKEENRVISRMIKSELLSYLKDVKMSETIIDGLNIDNIVGKAVSYFNQAIDYIRRESNNSKYDGDLLSCVKQLNSGVNIGDKEDCVVDFRYKLIRTVISPKCGANFYELFPFFHALDVFFVDGTNVGARGYHMNEDYMIKADELYIDRLISFALTGTLPPMK